MGLLGRALPDLTRCWKGLPSLPLQLPDTRARVRNPLEFPCVSVDMLLCFVKKWFSGSSVRAAFFVSRQHLYLVDPLKLNPQWWRIYVSLYETVSDWAQCLSATRRDFHHINIISGRSVCSPTSSLATHYTQQAASHDSHEKNRIITILLWIQLTGHPVGATWVHCGTHDANLVRASLTSLEKKVHRLSLTAAVRIVFNV